MRLIETTVSEEFADCTALFFTSEGLIVERVTASPVLHFAKTVEVLGLSLRSLHLDGALLIVQCEIVGPLKSQFRLVPPKLLLRETDQFIQQQILRANHWLEWDAKLQYCSGCGAKLHKVADLPHKSCSACRSEFFPSLSPAVIVLIQRGNDVLLARSPHFKPGLYSAIAGFIDLGETAEAAVHREVQEEVGLKISNLEYMGSQSWPFPSSFMIAFMAQYAGGELRLDPAEIEDAQWFNLNHLPEIPAAPSISRHLIECLRARQSC